MWAMLLFLAVSGSQTCDAGILPNAPLEIEKQSATCVQYASNAGVTVYGIEATQHSPRADFPHRVFVCYGTRRSGHSWRVLDRQEITGSLADAGERGYLIGLEAQLNRFTLGGAALIDVSLMTTISGTGGITGVTDLFFRIEGAKLHRVATLRNTDSWGRGGWSFARQVTSELLVDRDGMVMVKRDRTARGTNPERPLTVHCRVSYDAYQLRDGLLERIGPIDASDVRRRPKLRPIPRLENRPIIPCCAGCAYRN